MTRSLVANQAQIAKEISRDLDKLRRDVLPTAQRRATNRAANTTRGRAVKGIAKRFRIKQKIIRARTRVFTSKRNVVFRSYLEGVPVEILGPKGRLPKQTRRGIRVARRHYPHAFRAKVEAGSKLKESIFQRRGARRLPIDKVKVNLQPESRRIIDRVADRVLRRDYTRELNRQIELLARQRIARARR